MNPSTSPSFSQEMGVSSNALSSPEEPVDPYVSVLAWAGQIKSPVTYVTSSHHPLPSTLRPTCQRSPYTGLNRPSVDPPHPVCPHIQGRSSLPRLGTASLGPNIKVSLRRMACIRYS